MPVGRHLAGTTAMTGMSDIPCTKMVSSLMAKVKFTVTIDADKIFWHMTPLLFGPTSFFSLQLCQELNGGRVRGRYFVSAAAAESCFKMANLL